MRKFFSEAEVLPIAGSPQYRSVSFGPGDTWEKYNSTLRFVPGCSWLHDAKRICVPVNFLNEGEHQAALAATGILQDDRLLPEQAKLAGAVYDAGGGIVSLRTGAGKTRIALKTLEWVAGARPALRALVVCDSAVVSEWHREIALFMDPVLLQSIELEVLSFEKLAALPLSELRSVDWLCIDEVQKLGDSQTKRAAAVRQLVLRNMDAFRIALSGTLISHAVQRIWFPVWCVYPQQSSFTDRDTGATVTYDNTILGSRSQFNKRYLLFELRGLHLVPAGLNAAFAPELRGRLDEIIFTLEVPVTHGVRIEQETLPAGASAISRAVENLSLARATGAPPSLVMSPSKEFTRQLKRALRENGFFKKRSFDVEFLIAGKAAAEDRAAAVAAAVTDGKPVVAEISTVATGINFLAQFEQVYFLGLHPSAEIMRQCLGRWGRLNSRSETTLTFLIPEGAAGDSHRKLVEKLQARMDVIRNFQEHSGGQAALTSALENDEELLAELTKACGITTLGSDDEE